MTTIVDFSDEPKFPIRVVCTETGVRPVTLRAWERRHAILNPRRSENHYRLYSERDVEILRWIKNRVDNGISISSAVNELKSMNRSGVWPEAMPAAPAPRPQAGSIPPDLYTQQLFQALIHHNEAQAADILRAAHTLFELTPICMEIITPALSEIGEAWYRGEIRITTEHFASAFIRGRLLAMLQTYPTRRSSAYLLLGAAPNEYHEIGSLMMAVLLRAIGFRVEYLGPNIPLEDLLDYAGSERPQMIILTASLEPAARKLAHFQQDLKRLSPSPVFGYAGRVFDLHPDLRQSTPGVYLGPRMDEAIPLIRALLQKEKPKPPR